MPSSPRSADPARLAGWLRPAYVPGHKRLTVVATGPSGAAWSSDEGDTWTLLPGITNCWAVGFSSWKAGWLKCGNGQIYKIDFKD